MADSPCQHPLRPCTHIRTGHHHQQDGPLPPPTSPGRPLQEYEDTLLKEAKKAAKDAAKKAEEAAKKAEEEGEGEDKDERAAKAAAQQAAVKPEPPQVATSRGSQSQRACTTRACMSACRPFSQPLPQRTGSWNALRTLVAALRCRTPPLFPLHSPCVRTAGARGRTGDGGRRAAVL